jgi:hypothetical protein
MSPWRDKNMEALLMKLLLFEFAFVFLLTLRETGVTAYVYEVVYTHPAFERRVKLFGDVLYMVGGGVMTSVLFAALTSTDAFFLGTFVVGLLFTSLGAYLKK